MRAPSLMFLLAMGMQSVDHKGLQHDLGTSDRRGPTESDWRILVEWLQEQGVLRASL
jgi:hypothetical protein